MKYWKTAAAAVALSLSASAQIGPRDRILVRETPFVVSLTRVVFNDGRYAIVESKSDFDKYKDKKAEVACPAGLKAVSAGFSAASGAGEPADFRLIFSNPTENGSGWTIYARFDGKGNSLASDFDWELRIRLVCLKVP